MPIGVSQNIISLPKIDSHKYGHSASPEHAGEHAVRVSHTSGTRPT